VIGGEELVERGHFFSCHFAPGACIDALALRTPSGSYWVVNTLLDRLSNETMLAIAKGLRPLDGQ